VRRRILVVAISAVALAVALLGAPVGIAIERNAVTQERGELERAALQTAVAVSPSYRTGDPVELPTTESAMRVALYSPAGKRVTGTGPTTLEGTLTDARRGSVVNSSSSQDLIAAVPVSLDEKVIGIVRASSTRAAVRSTVTHQLLALAALTALALVLAGCFAFWQARRLAGPLRRLADAAGQLGGGDFSVRVPVSGVPEIDSTGEALTSTAQRLSEQIARERAFAAQASHQLRTPLTRLRLELEAGLHTGADGLATAVDDALATADHLSRTIDDVLALAREPDLRTSTFDVEALLADCVEHWRGVFATDDRPLRLVVDRPPPVRASSVAVRQILQVLIDNAYRHGRGTVTLTARESGGAVAVDVEDRGHDEVVWPDPDAAPGRLGLVMARDLAASQGGRLLLSSDPSGTRFTLLVPAAD
jgi:signal transduction histidine kinase